MTILQYFLSFVFFLLFIGLILSPLILIMALTFDWNRGKRIEEAMEYAPDPAYPVTRFCTSEEMRKGGW
jgi:hypothetical protein